MDDFFYILAALLLVFLFVGEPDVWDKLHERAMTSVECKQ